MASILIYPPFLSVGSAFYKWIRTNSYWSRREKDFIKIIVKYKYSRSAPKSLLLSRDKKIHLRHPRVIPNLRKGSGTRFIISRLMYNAHNIILYSQEYCSYIFGKMFNNSSCLFRQGLNKEEKNISSTISQTTLQLS